jgi:hypothetical protein
MIARRTLLALPPALLLAGAGSAGRGGALRWDSGYLFLRVRVNGRPADALLDLNAATTQVDREHAARLGITGAGARPIVEAAGRRLGPLAVKLSDLTDYANFKLHGRIALILGRDLFGAAPMLLDLAALSLAPSPSRGGRSGQPLPLTSRFGLDTVPVTIEGVRGHAALSLRGLEPMMISAGFAARAAIGRNRGGDRSAGAAMVSGIVIGRLEIAGRRFANVAAALNAGDQTPDAWIGPDILRHFRLELDLPARTIWFDPA